MVGLRFFSLCAVVLTAHGASVSKPRPSGLVSGTHSLGMVVPNLSGWGPAWNAPTTSPPETTTGWAPETTTSEPETTTGWGWTTMETTTPPPETTTGWPAPETTTPGWSPPGWTSPPVTGWPSPPATGWSPPSGWSAADVEPVNIEMIGESAVIGEGEAGATHGSETSVTGDSSNPAVAILNTGSYSSLGQGSGIFQLSNIADGQSNTFQGVDGYNFGDASEYYSGSLSGNQINTLNGGGSFVLGAGAIGQSAVTLNNGVLMQPPMPMGMGHFKHP